MAYSTPCSNGQQYSDRQLSDLLRKSFDVMTQGILIHRNGVILFANNKLAEMLEIPPKLINPGASFAEFIKFGIDRGDERDAPCNEVLSVAQAKIADDEEQIFERTTPSGKTIQLKVNAGSEGERVATYTDVTKDRKREAELAQARHEALKADRAKSEFLANMSHEIRTPMNGVMGMAELLATTELDAKQKMFTDVIIKSGASLLTIINDILDFSKIDAEQMELSLAPFDLVVAVEDVVTLVSSNSVKKELELFVRINPMLPDIVVGDVGRIRQIINNLVGNSVKFTESGHVYINVDGDVIESHSGGHVKLRFSIEDTGIGIPEGQRDKVFNKFAQIDNSTTRKHDGTGLGLSISSSLVKLMGGEIGVEGTLGKGVTFWFELELPIDAGHIRERIIPKGLSGAHILIIDDNGINRSILKEQMAASNLDSAAACSGLEGLKVMRAANDIGVNIDLVILNYHMAEIDGADVLRAMREDKMLNHIPVVMLTSIDNSCILDEVNGLRLEANLTKPARSSTLLDTISNVITKSRASDELRSSFVKVG